MTDEQILAMWRAMRPPQGDPDTVAVRTRDRGEVLAVHRPKEA